MVKMMIFVEGDAEQIWRVASMPFITGMLTSITTKSGLYSSTLSTASRPLLRLGADIPALRSDVEQAPDTPAYNFVIVHQYDSRLSHSPHRTASL